MLIRDELFDLSLYKDFHTVLRCSKQAGKGNLCTVLNELIVIESGHYFFWQEFFGIFIKNLDLSRRVKLKLLVLCSQVFGEKFIHLVLESIEVYGIRKYLSLWDDNKNTPFGKALKNVLLDELEHEDKIVSQFSERKIDPERIRSIFLGFNDGLVEILGAVSGFFAAFQEARSVLIAGVTVAVAGAVSMAAGTYVAVGSEKEILDIDQRKKIFLGTHTSSEEIHHVDPYSSSFMVGVSYFIGALFPVLPVLIGAKSVIISIIVGAIIIIIVSFVLAAISGMNLRRRILTNLVIIAAAVTISYGIGTAVNNIWGISF